MTFDLPWPPVGLSPNARLHWRKSAPLKKVFRAQWAWTAVAQGARKLDAKALDVHITFVPPDRRHRDTDNMLSSIKSGLDGLADALGVDDSRWTLTITRSDEVGGIVKVRVTESIN